LPQHFWGQPSHQQVADIHLQVNGSRWVFGEKFQRLGEVTGGFVRTVEQDEGFGSLEVQEGVIGAKGKGAGVSGRCDGVVALLLGLPRLTEKVAQTRWLRGKPLQCHQQHAQAYPNLQPAPHFGVTCSFLTFAPLPCHKNYAPLTAHQRRQVMGNAMDNFSGADAPCAKPNFR